MAEPHLALDSTVCAPTHCARSQNACNCPRHWMRTTISNAPTSSASSSWALQGYFAVGHCRGTLRLDAAVSTPCLDFRTQAFRQHDASLLSSPAHFRVHPAHFRFHFHFHLCFHFRFHFRFSSAFISGPFPLHCRFHFRPASAGPFPLPFPLSFPGHFRFHFRFHFRLISASISGPASISSSSPVHLRFHFRFHFRLHFRYISNPFPVNLFPLSFPAHFHFHFRLISASISGSFPLPRPVHFHISRPISPFICPFLVHFRSISGSIFKFSSFIREIHACFLGIMRIQEFVHAVPPGAIPPPAPKWAGWRGAYSRMSCITTLPFVYLHNSPPH